MFCFQTFTSSTSRVLRFNSPLYFANVDVFQDRIYKLLDIDINQLKKEKLGKFEDVHLSETNVSKVEGQNRVVVVFVCMMKVR